METPTDTPSTPPAHPAPGVTAGSPHRTLGAILADLRKPIPARLVSQKKVTTKKGSSYAADFVHHTTIRDLLDHYAPGWSWRVQLVHAGGLLYVVGTLTLHGSDGHQSRDGIGNEDESVDGYGDPSSNAEAQALRRAAMAHGLGRDLWRKK